MSSNHEFERGHEAPVSPDAALARYAGELASKEYPLIDETILNGEGVSAEFIAECKAAAKRLTDYRNPIDYETFPRDREGFTYRFFEGENLTYSYGKLNEINNPMRILRPRALSSTTSMVDYGIGYGKSPVNYAKTRSDRGYDDIINEQLYARAVSKYEDLFITVLEATNLDSYEDRTRTVMQKLDSIFAQTEYMSISSFSKLKSETPEGWLSHVVLAVLVHPSEEITPAARVRALDMLKFYNIEQLHYGFCKGKASDGLSFYNSGLQPYGLKQRLPHTLLRPEERHLDEHENWESHPELSPIVSLIQARNYRSATSEIVKRPLEAVQIALLFLRVYGKEDFGLGILRALPELDRKTQALMFGNRATFYKDNSISNKLEDQINQGAGINFDPTLGFDGMTAETIEAASPTELKRLLASALIQLRDAQDLNVKLVNQVDITPRGRQDPDGLYAVLGLNPNIASEYKDDELDTIIKSAFRAMTKVGHPDAGKQSDTKERNAKVDSVVKARDLLMDAKFRSSYGRAK